MVNSGTSRDEDKKYIIYDEATKNDVWITINVAAVEQKPNRATMSHIISFTTLDYSYELIHDTSLDRGVLCIHVKKLLCRLLLHQS